MRIITTGRLRDFAESHPTIAPTLRHWTELILRSRFASLVALRRLLPSADQVQVASGRTVTIFNIKNHYRLITAIHYNHQIVYILRLLTHNEYDQGHWKKHLGKPRQNSRPPACP
jgi:mRNA interferase HigB